MCFNKFKFVCACGENIGMKNILSLSLELGGYDFSDPFDGPWKSALFLFLVVKEFDMPALDHERNWMPGLQCKLRMVTEIFYMK
jgi:hypothetical protein